MIAIVITAYNSAAFLPDAVASVRAQRDAAFELLIVDDGSTDDTATVAASLGEDIRIFRQANQGAASARNTGVRETTADMIAFLDADDMWPAGRLALLEQQLTSDPSVLMVIGRTQLVVADPRGNGTPLRQSGVPWHAPLFGSALIRREAFTLTGPLDPALQPAEDMDWFIRARERSIPTAVVDDTTLLYRLHGSNITSGADPVRRNMLLALKRSLDRRRDASSDRPVRLDSWLPPGVSQQ